MGVRQLVLDDRHCRAEVVQSRRVLRRPEIGRRAHELGVGRHGEDPPHAFQIPRRHVLEALDQPPSGQVLLHFFLDLGRRLAKCIGVSRIFIRTLLQVVEQDAQLGIIIRIRGEQLHARPVAIAFIRRQRPAKRHVRAVHFDGGEQIGHAVLDRCRHAAGIILEKQTRALAEHFMRDRRAVA